VEVEQRDATPVAGTVQGEKCATSSWLGTVKYTVEMKLRRMPSGAGTVQYSRVEGENCDISSRYKTR
jgi:hypothetical protein